MTEGSVSRGESAAVENADSVVEGALAKVKAILRGLERPCPAGFRCPTRQV